MDIMTALATASQAIKLAQDLRGIDKAIGAAEYKLKIADLTTALSEIKLALTEAKAELAAKDEEIEDLKKQFERRAELVEYKGYKYTRGPHGKPRGRPYCPVCEQRGVLFPLADLHGGLFFCPNCKSNAATQLKIFPD
jgi:hypothetical protein